MIEKRMTPALVFLLFYAVHATPCMASPGHHPAAGPVSNVMMTGSYVTGPAQLFTVAVRVNNTAPFTAFQFDLPVPAGFEYITGSAALDTARSNGHLLQAGLLAGNMLRVFSFSDENLPFAGDTGTVVTFTLRSATSPGVYPLDLLNPVIGDTAQVNIITAHADGSVLLLAPDIGLSNDTLAFGSVPLPGNVPMTLVIANVGNQDLHITAIAFGDPGFEADGDTPFTITAGSNYPLTVRFVPAHKGTFNTLMTIACDDPDEPAMAVRLTATAYPVNELHAGNISAYSGDHALLTLSVNNMEPVTGLQFDLTLPPPLRYLPGSATLTARAADHLVSAATLSGNRLRVIAWSPGARPFAGDSGALLTLAFLVSGTGGTYPLALQEVKLGDTLGANCLSGAFDGLLAVAAPDIHCMPSLPFGDVAVGDSADRSLFIYNTGTDTLFVHGAGISGNAFTLVSGLPLTITPGNNGSLQVRFRAAAKGEVSGILTICSNDPEPSENPLKIALTAHAFAPNGLTVESLTCRNADTVTVNVDVANTEPFVGFQFDLLHPPFMQYLPGSVGPSPRAGGFAVHAAAVAPGQTRVVGYAPQLAPCTPGNGTLVSLRFAVLIADTTATSAAIALTGASLADTAMTNILSSAAAGALTIVHPRALEGAVMYNNNLSTPLDSVWMFLCQNGTPIDSALTDLAGHYLFAQVYPGQYTINGTTGKPFGGINSTDALMIRLHFVGTQYLTVPVRITAADVNAGGYINGTDALNVQLRFVGIDTAFQRGDWVIERTGGGDTVSMNIRNRTVNWYGLCTGDVNGSYVPAAGSKEAGLLHIDTRSEVRAEPGGECYLPVTVNRDLQLGAVSLELRFPAEAVTVTAVESPYGKPLWSSEEGMLRVSITSLPPLEVREGEPFLFFRIKLAEESVTPGGIRFSNDSPATGLAGPLAGPIHDAAISIPTVVAGEGSANNGPALFPNPAGRYAFLVDQLPGQGEVTILITDLSGRLQMKHSQHCQSAGIFRADLDVSALRPGVYPLLFRFTGQQESHTHTRKLVVTGEKE